MMPAVDHTNCNGMVLFNSSPLVTVCTDRDYKIEDNTNAFPGTRMDLVGMQSVLDHDYVQHQPRRICHDAMDFEDSPMKTHLTKASLSEVSSNFLMQKSILTSCDSCAADCLSVGMSFVDVSLPWSVDSNTVLPAHASLCDSIATEDTSFCQSTMESSVLLSQTQQLLDLHDIDTNHDELLPNNNRIVVHDMCGNVSNYANSCVVSSQSQCVGVSCGSIISSIASHANKVDNPVLKDTKRISKTVLNKHCTDFSGINSISPIFHFNETMIDQGSYNANNDSCENQFPNNLEGGNVAVDVSFVVSEGIISSADVGTVGKIPIDVQSFMNSLDHDNKSVPMREPLSNFSSDRMVNPSCLSQYNGDIGHLSAFTDSCCLTVEPSNARQRKIQPEYFKEITICQPYCDGHTDIINTDHCYGKISHNMAHVKKPYKNHRQRNLFFCGIPRNYTKDDLYQRFTRFGPVEEVKIYREHRPGRDDFGFVIFRYPEDFQQALQKGNDDPSEVKLTLNYGNRSQFVLDKYKDLDGNKAIDENYSFYQREKAEDYADLLASVRRSKVY